MRSSNLEEATEGGIKEASFSKRLTGEISMRLWAPSGRRLKYSGPKATM